MADLSEIKEAEVVPETALATTPKPSEMSLLVKPGEQALLSVIETLDNLDWRALKPHQTALLLMQKPFPASGGGMTYLSFKQAILFATRCFELGVSPFSSEVWFDPNRGVTNLTLEGKRQVARNRGIDLGPPQFTELSRDWSEVPKMNEAANAAKVSGFPRDIGIKCRIRVGDVKNQEFSEYTAYLSEWYVSRSPVWQQKPLHMLQTRATEKAISMCLGTGASDPVDD